METPNLRTRRTSIERGELPDATANERLFAALYGIDTVRARRALKRGSEFHITQLPTEIKETCRDEGELSRLSEAPDELAVHDPRLAEVVDLRYFCGYTFEEIAAPRGE